MIDDNVLTTFVLNNHTPIRAKLIFNALEGILAYNVLDIVPLLEEIILNDDLDTTHQIEAFKTQITLVIKEIIKAMDIKVYGHVTDFVVLSKIIDGIDKALREYYPDYILENTDIDNEDESNDYRLFSMIKTIEDINELEFHDVIHTVRPEVVEGIVRTLKEKVIEEIDSDDPVILERYKKFIAGRNTGVVSTFIANGGKVGGLDSDSLLELLSISILDNPAPDRAYDIVSTLLISTDELDTLKDKAIEWAKYFSNLEAENVLIEDEVLSLINW